MANLAQTLNAVLKNSDMEKFEEKIDEIEKMVEEMQITTQQAR